MKPKYNRILLKLSGESLAGDQKTGIDFDKVVEICKPIKKCVDAGVQVGIVVGGGNFWREAEVQVIWTEQEQTIWVCLQLQLTLSA